ncbi:glutaredoxin family protein [Pseudactinotalea sp. Z1748]|uniref:glutaredoxin family protein n=1 Tax=Pseudactinotalea sp. Z1748 TaxID=3413027 RepID=UPI003C7CDAB7
MDESTVRVELVVREQCHLCEQARRVVRSVCEPAAVDWVEVDVDEDPARQRRYGELVPVVLVDGVQVDYWQIDPDRLRAALQGAGAPGRRGLRELLRRRRQQ